MGPFILLLSFVPEASDGGKHRKKLTMAKIIYNGDYSLNFGYDPNPLMPLS
jgi:hypothetical protein